MKLAKGGAEAPGSKLLRQGTIYIYVFLCMNMKQHIHMDLRLRVWVITVYAEFDAHSKP